MGEEKDTALLLNSIVKGGRGSRVLDSSGGDGSASDSSGWRAYNVSGSDSFAG